MGRDFIGNPNRLGEYVDEDELDLDEYEAIDYIGMINAGGDEDDFLADNLYMDNADDALNDQDVNEEALDDEADYYEDEDDDAISFYSTNFLTDDEESDDDQPHFVYINGILVCVDAPAYNTRSTTAAAAANTSSTPAPEAGGVEGGGDVKNGNVSEASSTPAPVAPDEIVEGSS